MSGSHKLLLRRPISFYPVLREITGSIAAAIMLQQVLHWWDKKSGETLYKTVAEMEEETSLTTNEQRTAIIKLKQAGFISVEKKGLPAKRHFTVFIDKINDALNTVTSDVKSTHQSGEIHSTSDVDLTPKYPADSPDRCGEINGANTETTSESTTDTTEERGASANSSSENDLLDETKKQEHSPDELQTKLLRLTEIVGPRLGSTRAHPQLGMTSTLQSWITSGADYDLDILPAVTALAGKKKSGVINSWTYFSGAVADTMALRTAGLPPVSAAALQRIRRAKNGKGGARSPEEISARAVEAMEALQAKKKSISKDEQQGAAT
jgi:hypothetical protein